ncbi:MAG: hypothetical protein IKF98_00230 [Clostridia bacterium]|nr:hypothetical protein [Clostridia bacterium]MBR3272319.1 hypothetical protein [Clostridia bacterium]
MAEYTIIADTIEAAYRASAIIDRIMNRDSGQIAVVYQLADGQPLPGIDTGYLNPRGLRRARRIMAPAILEQQRNSKEAAAKAEGRL